MEEYLPFKPGAAGALTDAEKKRIAKDVEDAAKKPREIDEEIEKQIGITPQDVLDVWNSVDAGRNNPDLLTFIQGLSDAEKKSIVLKAMKGMLGDNLKHLVRIVKEKTGKKITVFDTPDKAALKKMVQDAIETEAKKRKLWNDKEVFDEAYRLSKEWRPYDEAHASPKTVKYRKSGKEVYADMISVLFHSPGMLEEKAPKFFEAFMNYLDNKPEFKAVYEDLQKALKGDVLEKRSAGIQEGYEEGRKKRGENIKLEQSDETKWQKAKREYLSIFYPVLNILPDVKDPTGGFTAREQVRNQLEKWEMWKSKTSLLMDNYERNITDPLEKEGISLDDVGELVQYNRGMSAARMSKANPGGIQGHLNAEGYQKVMDKYTPKQQKLIEEKLNDFFEMNFEVMKDARDAGLISDGLWKEVEENKFNYATFKPVDFIDGMIHGADFKKIEGTLRDIENPFSSTIAKMAVVQRAAETNRAKTVTINAIKTHDPAGIKETTQTITGKTSEKVGATEDVIRVKEKGENKYYIVDQHIADIFNRSEPNEISTAVQVAHKIGQPLKQLWTTLSPNFAFVSNPIRDASRTIRGMYAINAANNAMKWHDILTLGPKYVKNYLGSLKDAASMLRHDPSAVISRMLANNAINPESAIFENYNPELSGMANIFSHYKFMAEHFGIEAPKAKTALAKGYDNLKKGFDWVTSPLRYASKITEFAGKITPYKMLEKRLGGEKAAFYTRNFGGTPNFSEKTAADYSWVPFAKVILQGLRNEVSLATNKRTAGAYWLANAVYTVLPAVLTGMAKSGYFDNDKDKEGEKLSDIYKKAGKYQRYNYRIIPLGHNKQTGDARFISIPMDEGALTVHQNVMNLFEDESAAQHARDVSSSVTNMLPSLSSYDIYSNWGKYLAGQNPHDTYYNRDLITDRHFKQGGAAAFKDMLKYTVNTVKPFGINIPYYDESPSKRTPKGSMLSNIPILSKLYKETSIGDYEELKKLKGLDDKEHADRSEKIDEAVMKAFKDAASETLQTGKYNAGKILTDAWKNYSGKDKPETKEDIVAYQQLKSVVLLSLKADKVQSVPQALSILNAGTNTLKKKYLDLYKKNMSEAEYNNLIKLLQQSGVTLPK
jgi:hypothetical protein